MATFVTFYDFITTIGLSISAGIHGNNASNHRFKEITIWAKDCIPLKLLYFTL
jgi:hypothetical protein